MARRRLDQPVGRQPVGGTIVQRCLLDLRQRGKAIAQRLVRQRVHAQPFARLADDEHRRVARQTDEPLGGIVGVHQRPAQIGMQVVEDGDASQEREVGRVEVGQQQAHRRPRSESPGAVGAENGA